MHHFECTPRDWIVHFDIVKMDNFMLCEFYHNKIEKIQIIQIYLDKIDFMEGILQNTEKVDHQSQVGLVAQSCLTFCDPMFCSPPGSLVHRIFQARTLEWGAIHFFRGFFQPRHQTWVSCWNSLGPHKRLPVFLVVTQEKPHTSHCSSKQNPRDFPIISRWGALFLHGLESNPESSLKTPQEAWLPLATQLAARDTRRNSRGERSSLLPLERGLTPWVKFECNPEIPVATGKEHGICGHMPRWGLFALQWLESNPRPPL